MCDSKHRYLLCAVRRLKSRLRMLLHAGVLARCRGVLLPRVPTVRLCLRHIACTVRGQERHCFVAPEESATKHLAALLARDLRAGDCYCLHGEVGAGKSVFSQFAVEDSLDLPLRMMSCLCRPQPICCNKFMTTIQGHPYTTLTFTG